MPPNQRKLFERYGIPEEFWEASLSDFSKEITENCLKLLLESPTRSLYLYGLAGRGKTRFAFALIKYLLDEYYSKHSSRHIASIHYAGLSDILLEIRETFDRKGVSERSVLYSFFEYDYLFIDDLGQERRSDFSRWTLLKIADHRRTSRKPTVYITDQPYSNMLNNLFDDRIMSRIYQNVVHFKGADRRQLDIRRMEIGG